MLARTPPTELDYGPRRSPPGSERLCAATRTVKPIDRMIRFVLGPDGVVPDLKRKLPGRGVWITADRSTLRDAVSRNVFARSFKRDVRVTPELVAMTEGLLVRAALDALAIAGKSGLVITGFSRVEGALAHEKTVALLHATEAAEEGVRKLNRIAQRHSAASPCAIVTIFGSAQLDLALGRPNVVHAALLAGPASDTFMARIARLERFRTGESGNSDGNPVRN